MLQLSRSDTLYGLLCSCTDVLYCKLWCLFICSITLADTELIGSWENIKCKWVHQCNWVARLNLFIFACVDNIWVWKTLHWLSLFFHGRSCRKIKNKTTKRWKKRTFCSTGSQSGLEFYSERPNRWWMRVSKHASRLAPLRELLAAGRQVKAEHDFHTPHPPPTGEIQMSWWIAGFGMRRPPRRPRQAFH